MTLPPCHHPALPDAAHVRLGCVKYLNTLPLIEGVAQCEGVDVVSAVPSRLFGMLHNAEADAALVSVIDAAHPLPRADHPDTPALALLPVGMIGSDAETLTVRVFSRVPMDRITTLHADTDSHTSTVLARILLKHLFGAEPRIADYHARERMAIGVTGEPEAVLLIGDKVVADAPATRAYEHQLDLGAAWREWTGLPFVYAVWMCRAADLAAEPARAKIKRAAMLLDRARRHNATRIGWIASHHAHRHGWPAEQARSYLAESLRFAVHAPQRQAVERFLDEAAKLGLCAPTRVHWADDLLA